MSQIAFLVAYNISMYSASLIKKNAMVDYKADFKLTNLSTSVIIYHVKHLFLSKFLTKLTSKKPMICSPFSCFRLNRILVFIIFY